MRAPEHQHVDAGALQRLEILPRDQLGGGVVEPSFLDEGHEQGAGLGTDGRIGPERPDGPLVGTTRDRARGPDHADFPGSGRRHGRARPRLDHADQGDRTAGGEVVEGVGTDGVAGHDEGLHAAPQEVRENLARVAAHRVR